MRKKFVSLSLCLCVLCSLIVWIGCEDTVYQTSPVTIQAPTQQKTELSRESSSSGKVTISIPQSPQKKREFITTWEHQRQESFFGTDSIVVTGKVYSCSYIEGYRGHRETIVVFADGDTVILRNDHYAVPLNRIVTFTASIESYFPNERSIGRTTISY